MMRSTVLILAILVAATACKGPDSSSQTAPAAPSTGSGYPVTYWANGATGGSVPTDSQLYTPGANVPIQANPNNLVKAGGFVLAGWTTQADGSGTSYAPVATNNYAVMGSTGLQLYALWVPSYFLLGTGNTVVIMGTTASSLPVNLDIPEGITGIGNEAFAGSAVTTVTVPPSVQTIGTAAFRGCSSLTAVALGAGVSHIASYAFTGCPALTGFTVDAANQSYASEAGILVTKDGKTLVQVPGGLAACQVPAGVTSLGMGFYQCAALKQVTFAAPGAVTDLGTATFFGCTDLGSIDLSALANVTQLPASAFNGCTALGSVTLPPALTAVGDAAFSGTAVTTVSLPASLVTLGEAVFDGCPNLSSLTVPPKVTSLGGFEFELCPALGSLTFLPAGPPALNSSTFSGTTPAALTIHVPSLSAYSAWGSYGVLTTP